MKEPMIQRELRQRGAFGEECVHHALLIGWMDVE